MRAITLSVLLLTIPVLANAGVWEWCSDSKCTYTKRFSNSKDCNTYMKENGGGCRPV